MTMRSRLISASWAAVLSLTLSVAAQAQQDAPRTRDQSPSQPQDPTRTQPGLSNQKASAAMQPGSVRGVVVEVVSAGEQMINPLTNQPMAAQGNFVKVLGRSSHAHSGSAGMSPGARDANRPESDAGAADNRDLNATTPPTNRGTDDNPASTRVGGLSRQRETDARANSNSSMMGQDRPQLFVISLTTQTQIRQARPNAANPPSLRGATPNDEPAPSSATGSSTKDASRTEPPATPETEPGAAAARTEIVNGVDSRQNTTLSSFNQLEIGDWVEIQFASQPAPLASNAPQKHGRNRIHQAIAAAITVMPSNSMTGMDGSPGFNSPNSRSRGLNSDAGRESDTASPSRPEPNADRNNRDAGATGSAPR